MALLLLTSIWISTKTGKRGCICSMSFWTVNQSRLIVDTGHDCLFIVVVSWIGIKTIVNVFFRTTDSKHILSAASFLIWPIASVNSIIIDKSVWFAWFPFWDSPCTFGIVWSTVTSCRVRKDSKLPWASWGRYWSWSSLSFGTRNIPVMCAKFIDCSVFLIEESIRTRLQ